MTTAGLAWFELTSALPSTLGILRRRLGARRLATVLAALPGALARDPFADLGPPASGPAGRRDRLSRRQARPVVALDEILRDRLGLGAGARLELLGEIVASSGARFVARNVPALDRARWEALDPPARDALVDRIAAAFFNAEVARVEAPGAELALDVTACRFVELFRAIGRPELAPLFCAADEAYFGDPRNPVALDRAETLAKGQPRCDFRFRFRD